MWLLILILLLAEPAGAQQNFTQLFPGFPRPTQPRPRTPQPPAPVPPLPNVWTVPPSTGIGPQPFLYNNRTGDVWTQFDEDTIVGPQGETWNKLGNDWVGSGGDTLLGDPMAPIPSLPMTP